tara:strand:- start:111 stop:464 length:354 start_codon:yes stop_codon:yes gene_type:complete
VALDQVVLTLEQVVKEEILLQDLLLLQVVVEEQLNNQTETQEVLVVEQVKIEVQQVQETLEDLLHQKEIQEESQVDLQEERAVVVEPEERDQTVYKDPQEEVVTVVHQQIIQLQVRL